MRLRRYIEKLGPYQSLTLLAVPTATVEPLKLIAVAIAGAGHWITGAAMIVACYTLSLVLVERLFIIVKPKLLDSMVRQCLEGVRFHSNKTAYLVQTSGQRFKQAQTQPRRR